MLGVWLVCAPFFLIWLLLYRRELRSRWWHVLTALQVGLLTFYLLLSAIDHEIVRFLGVRLNPSFIWAYSRPEMLSDRLFLDLIGADRGGPYLSLALILAGPLLFLLVAARLLRLRPRPLRPLAGARPRAGAAGGAGQWLADGDQPVPPAQDRAGADRVRRGSCAGL